MFSLKTRVSVIDTFGQFIERFSLNEKDLVITQSFLYDAFMKHMDLPCSFVMQDEYGNGEPSDEMINNIIHDLDLRSYDRIIAIGGGTVIDISKILVLKNINDVVDAFERKIPVVKEKSLVILPTTCGTGSEVTNISIAEIKSKHIKMGLTDDTMLADDAVLVPELLKGLPFKFYVFSAIDALIHAMESYVSPKADCYSRMFSKEATHIILDVFKGIAEFGPDYRLERLEEIHVAANYAGIAFGNAGVGAVHAMSYPLGANYHVAHGEANYQFFIEVFRFYNEKSSEGIIKELNDLLIKELKLSANADYNTIYDALTRLLDKLISRKPLREFGMKEKEVDEFAENVIKTQQRLLNNNYVAMTQEEIKEIYLKLF